MFMKKDINEYWFAYSFMIIEQNLLSWSDNFVGVSVNQTELND